MDKLKLGRENSLSIMRYTDHGAYLDGGEAGEILMPKRYVPAESRVGDVVDVFVYLDQEERIVATTETPLARVDDFAFLTVSWVNQYGAFLHWGLMKDLFVPFSEQKKPMEQGRAYVVYVYIDEETGRITSTARVERYLSDEEPPYELNDGVGILVWQRTDLGYKVIVDNMYQGLVYENEVFSNIRIGERLHAYVKKVREDGKMDIALQPQGKSHVEDFSVTLLSYIEEAGGFIPFTDKSPSEAIYQRFGVSKKVFKKAVGTLYKQHRITLSDAGISMTRL